MDLNGWNDLNAKTDLSTINDDDPALKIGDNFSVDSNEWSFTPSTDNVPSFASPGASLSDTIKSDPIWDSAPDKGTFNPDQTLGDVPEFDFVKTDDSKGNNFVLGNNDGEKETKMDFGTGEVETPRASVPMAYGSNLIQNAQEVEIDVEKDPREYKEELHGKLEEISNKTFDGPSFGDDVGVVEFGIQKEKKEKEIVISSPSSPEKMTMVEHLKKGSDSYVPVSSIPYRKRAKAKMKGVKKVSFEKKEEGVFDFGLNVDEARTFEPETPFVGTEGSEVFNIDSGGLHTPTTPFRTIDFKRKSQEEQFSPNSSRNMKKEMHEEALFKATRKRDVYAVKVLLEGSEKMPVTSLAVNTSLFLPYRSLEVFEVLLRNTSREFFLDHPHLLEKIKDNEEASRMYKRHFQVSII